MEVIQNKFLWRLICRPLFPEGTGTPVEMTKEHLPALRNAFSRLDEFTSSPYSQGRCHFGGITRSEIEQPLNFLIQSLEKYDEVLVLD